MLVEDDESDKSGDENKDLLLAGVAVLLYELLNNALGLVHIWSGYW